MTDIPAAYARLAAATEQLAPVEREAAALRREIERIALDLLRAGEPPSVVADLCPFTATHLRSLARAAGIPPARRGGGKKKPSV